jgi:hypothetical protein
VTAERLPDEKRVKNQNLEAASPQKQSAPESKTDQTGLLKLQQQVGNRAVQRLLAQRSGDGGFDLDDQTAGRINQARGGGQALDTTVQTQMSQNMGHDFGGVRVHTSPEADTLNQQLNAKAFTTGQDIFFRQGAYEPGSSSGRELLAHELTHVVQQSSGAVGGSGGGMRVNPPGDAFEQEADAVANETVQREAAPDEEELQMKPTDNIQREAVPDEEELQMKSLDNIQREAAPDEEELQMKVQRKKQH